MAFDLPAVPSSDFDSLTGDVESDAFSGETRIVSVPLSSFPSMAAGTVLANVTAGDDVPTAHPLATLAGAGLVYTNVTGVINVVAGAGGSLVVGASDIQRGALTGAITAAQDSNTTAFKTFAAKSVLANATNATAIPTELAGSAAFQYLRVDSSNAGLEWATLSVAAPITLTSGTIGFDSTATLDNNARIAVRKNSGAVVGTRRRLNLIEGSGITLTITDDAGSEEVDVTIESSASATVIDPQRVLGNDGVTSAAASETTVHQVLDWIGGSVQWIFDGVDDSALVGDQLHFERTDSFTLSAWINATSSVNGSIFGNARNDATARGYNLFNRTTAPVGLMLELNNDSVSNAVKVYIPQGTFDLLDGQEHHVVATYSGNSAPSGVKLYIDGVNYSHTTFGSFTAISATMVPTAATTNLRIGSRDSGFSHNGALRHASVWDAELTALEVTELYNSGGPGDLLSHSAAANLKLWLKFDDTDATGAGGIVDHSTSNFDATAQNGLAPTTARGAIPTRGDSNWVLISPNAKEGILTSNGPTEVPSFRSPTLFPETVTGTLNNRALPTGFRSRDILSWTLSANTTLTGIDATGLSEGYELILYPGTAPSFQLAISNEAGGSTSTNRIQTPNGNTLVLREDAALRLRRNSTRWFAETIGWPSGSTSLAYTSTGELQRAALSGAIVAAQNVNTTVFAGIRANGSATTDRTNINFISGTGITVAATDDAGNDEIELTFSATAASVTPTTVAVFGTPTNTGIPFIIYVSFAAGTPGTADDVTVFSSTAPFNFRILESWLVTGTAIGSSTVQARTATGGLGSALSTAMSSTVAGKTSDNSTATVTVASGGSVFLRRSDRGVAGEFFAMCVRT